ncbi:MAG: GFA family protein [Steroidobacteraceae bacterium]
MTSNITFPLEGGCDCGHVRYRMEAAPLIVHCCHCRWCQRETGTAFALNAMIEAEHIVHSQAEPDLIDTPSLSGRGQKIARCPNCRIAVWSNYGGAGPILRFVRIGTLDTPHVLQPDVHIYTSSKQPWVQLPQGVPAVSEYYEVERMWSPESLARRAAFLPRLRAYRASHGL